MFLDKEKSRTNIVPDVWQLGTVWSQPEEEPFCFWLNCSNDNFSARFAKMLRIKTACQKAFQGVTHLLSICHSSLISPSTFTLSLHLLHWLEAKSKLSQSLTPAVDAALGFAAFDGENRIFYIFFWDWAHSISSFPTAWHSRSQFEAPNYHISPLRVCSNMSYQEPSAAIYLAQLLAHWEGTLRQHSSRQSGSALTLFL